MDTLKIAQNAHVEFRGATYTISYILDLERVILRDDFTGEKKRVNISELGPCNTPANKPINQLPLDGYSPKQWSIAESRLTIIEPLIQPGFDRTASAVLAASEAANTAPSTLYRWISSYEATGRLSSLVPAVRNDKGKSRLDSDSEALITEVIENHYLKSNKINISQAYTKLEGMAKRSKITLPSKQTFTRRIKSIKKIESVKRRDGKEKSRALYSGISGNYTEASFPISIVQIDHTPIDLMLVDEENREVVGRAWLTVAICVYSRVVCGYHLTYEAPSAMSVGQCLINSILPKEEWLQDRAVECSWPIWGVMSNLHADNGKDFHTRSLDRSCQEYGININWRPLGRADFGGHIERLLGTFNKDIHQLEGTTFSNIQERGRYKSEQRAILTLAEFDKWLCIYITKIYHQKFHTGIKTSPLEKLEEGYMGTDEILGSGLPGKILDENRLRMDFLPVIYRTVQRYGIEIDNIRYYSTAISKWIKEKSTDKHAPEGKFVIKRDPRDISKVYFLDPEINEYLEIPCINRGAPSLTLWELKALTNKLKQQGVSSIDEDLIFQARDELERIESAASKKTKHMRRKAERQREAKKSLRKSSKTQSKRPTKPNNKTVLEDGIFDSKIEPFDDIRELE